MIPDFKIDENLVVEFFLPDEINNAFILGISQLGGTDVLGFNNIFEIGVSLIGGDDLLGPGNSFVWQNVNCETAEAEISIGGSINDAVYFQPEPATANLTLQSYALDPTVNNSVRAGTKIRVRLASALENHVLFIGYIDTIDVTYYPLGPNLIRITAYDIYKSLVNARIANWDTTVYGVSATTDEIFDLIATETGIAHSASSLPTVGKIPTVSLTNISVTDVINDPIDVGLAVVWIDQETEELVTIPRPLNPVESLGTPIIGNNHPPFGTIDPLHYCLGEIVVSSDADAVYNSLRVSLSYDDTTSVFLTNQDSIELYGESAIDVAINTTDATELARWATAVYEQAPTKLVSRVMTPAIDRLGDLTSAAVLTPGTVVFVSYNTNDLEIMGYYTIIRVNHEIDVNTWFTSLDLWKAA
jgi:hypothetical protein